MSAHRGRRAPRWVLTALRPLRYRDFRLLWMGLAVSLVGSGLWLVALAWQVIELGGARLRGAPRLIANPSDHTHSCESAIRIKCSSTSLGDEAAG